MGVIQGSINSMLGAVAGAAVSAKKIPEMQAKAESAKVLETAKLTEEIPALKEEIVLGKQEEQSQLAEIEKVKSGRTDKGQFRSKAEINKDLEMRQLALSTLQGKLSAKTIQLAEYQKRFESLGGNK